MTAGKPTESQLRLDMCEMGRRLWLKGFCAANEGNLSCRLDDDYVLCTPTMISKGFMNPEDLVVVDYDLNQVRGERRFTSEIRLHLEIYRQDENVRAVVHCHPPHATAFALTHREIPTGLLPEPEVFLGVIPRTAYDTPGTDAFAASIRPHVRGARAAVLENHGTVSWSSECLERAFWNTEILDAYCRILLLATSLGPPQPLAPDKLAALRDIRKAFGDTAAGDD